MSPQANILIRLLALTFGTSLSIWSISQSSNNNSTISYPSTCALTKNYVCQLGNLTHAVPHNKTNIISCEVPIYDVEISSKNNNNNSITSTTSTSIILCSLLDLSWLHVDRIILRQIEQLHNEDDNNDDSKDQSQSQTERGDDVAKLHIKSLNSLILHLEDEGSVSAHHRGITIENPIIIEGCSSGQNYVNVSLMREDPLKELRDAKTANSLSRVIINYIGTCDLLMDLGATDGENKQRVSRYLVRSDAQKDSPLDLSWSSLRLVDMIKFFLSLSHIDLSPPQGRPVSGQYPFFQWAQNSVGGTHHYSSHNTTKEEKRKSKIWMENIDRDLSLNLSRNRNIIGNLMEALEGIANTNVRNLTVILNSGPVTAANTKKMMSIKREQFEQFLKYDDAVAGATANKVQQQHILKADYLDCCHDQGGRWLSEYAWNGFRSRLSGNLTCIHNGIGMLRLVAEKQIDVTCRVAASSDESPSLLQVLFGQRNSWNSSSY